jgi:hypothetical protein
MRKNRYIVRGYLACRGCWRYEIFRKERRFSDINGLTWQRACEIAAFWERSGC